MMRSRANSDVEMKDLPDFSQLMSSTSKPMDMSESSESPLPSSDSSDIEMPAADSPEVPLSTSSSSNSTSSHSDSMSMMNSPQSAFHTSSEQLKFVIKTKGDKLVAEDSVMEDAKSQRMLDASMESKTPSPIMEETSDESDGDSKDERRIKKPRIDLENQLLCLDRDAFKSICQRAIQEIQKINHASKQKYYDALLKNILNCLIKMKPWHGLNPENILFEAEKPFQFIIKNAQAGKSVIVAIGHKLDSQCQYSLSIYDQKSLEELFILNFNQKNNRKICAQAYRNQTAPWEWVGNKSENCEDLARKLFSYFGERVSWWENYKSERRFFTLYQPVMETSKMDMTNDNVLPSFNKPKMRGRLIRAKRTSKNEDISTDFKEDAHSNSSSSSHSSNNAIISSAPLLAPPPPLVVAAIPSFSAMSHRRAKRVRSLSDIGASPVTFMPFQPPKGVFMEDESDEKKQQASSSSSSSSSNDILPSNLERLSSGITCVWLNEENENELMEYFRKIHEKASQPNAILDAFIHSTLEGSEGRRLFTDFQDNTERLGFKFNEKFLVLAVNKMTKQIHLSVYLENDQPENLFYFSFLEDQMSVFHYQNIKHFSPKEINCLLQMFKEQFKANSVSEANIPLVLLPPVKVKQNISSQATVLAQVVNPVKANVLRLTPTPFEIGDGKKRSQTPKLNKRNRNALEQQAKGTSWDAALTKAELIKLIETHKDEPWELRLEHVIYDHAYKEKMMYSGKEYEVYSQYVKWTGEDGNTYYYKACFNAADCLRPQAYAGDKRCTSWLFASDEKGLPVPLLESEPFTYKEGTPPLYELHVFQRGSEQELEEVIKDVGCRDGFGDSSQKHTGIGEFVGLHVGPGEKGIPANESFRLYATTYLPLFGRAKTYSIDAANLEAEEAKLRLRSQYPEIEALATTVWEDVINGVKTSLVSFIQYGESDYQRKAKPTSFVIKHVDGTFPLAFDGVYDEKKNVCIYNQSDAARQVALADSKDFTLEDYYGRLMKQKEKMLPQLAQKQNEILTTLASLLEHKALLSLPNLEALRKKLETIIKVIGEKRKEGRERLIRCERFRAYKEAKKSNSVKPFQREHLLEIMGFDKEILNYEVPPEATSYSKSSKSKRGKTKAIPNKVRLKSLETNIEDDDNKFLNFMTELEQKTIAELDHMKKAIELCDLYDQYKKIEWQTKFPTVLQCLAKEQFTDFSMQDNGQNPFAGSKRTVKELLLKIKEKSIRSQEKSKESKTDSDKNKKGPSSSYLALNNLLTFGTNLSFPPSRDAVEKGSIEEVWRWSHEFTGGSLVMVLEPKQQAQQSSPVDEKSERSMVLG